MHRSALASFTLVALAGAALASPYPAETVALTGTDAPGTDGQFSRLGQLRVAPNGDVIFGGRIEGSANANGGWWLAVSGTVRAYSVDESPPPSGTLAFPDPFNTRRSDVAFGGASAVAGLSIIPQGQRVGPGAA